MPMTLWIAIAEATAGANFEANAGASFEAIAEASVEARAGACGWMAQAPEILGRAVEFCTAHRLSAKSPVASLCVILLRTSP